MNQAEVKEILLKIEGNVPDFQVIFSGKSSKKVNGLYKPDSMEILIHNRNFEDDNALLYTAIHEYAHHVHFNSNEVERPSEKRSHTIAFRNILHKLLNRAEELRLYKSVFESQHDFQDLTRKIREQYLTKNGVLMKDFGRLLVEAYSLCQKYNANFDDYIERSLSLHRTQAKSMMKVFALDLDPKIGFENMKIASTIKDPSQRAVVEEMMIAGRSQDETRAFIRDTKPEPEDSAKRLLAEKQRLEKSLEKLQQRLAEVEQKLVEYND